MSGSCDRRQALERGLAGGDGGQALLHFAAVGLKVQCRHGLDDRACAGLRWPRATRWSARGRDFSSVQAWKAATSWPWLMIPFCSASSPKRRWRSAAAVMARLRAKALSPASPTTGTEPGREGNVATRVLSHAGSGGPSPPVHARRSWPDASSCVESALLNERTNLLLCWGLRTSLRTESPVVRVGPTTPKQIEPKLLRSIRRLARKFSKSLDHTVFELLSRLCQAVVVF